MRRSSSWWSGRSSARRRVPTSCSNSRWTPSKWRFTLSADSVYFCHCWPNLPISWRISSLVCSIMKLSNAWRMTPRKANRVSGEHITTRWAMASSSRPRVVLVDEAGELLVGQEQQHVVDGRAVALAGVLAAGQLLDPQAHVGEEALEVRLALGVGADLEVAQVRRQRELDVHVQHVALGQLERVVRPAGAAVDLGLLAVVDVLGEAGQAEHVLGHALAPLATGLRVGEGLAQHPGGVGQGGGDLGVGAQRLVDLAEALGAGRADVADQLAEALQLGAHLGADLVEAGVDDVLLRREVGLHAGGRRAELLAVEHGGVLERRAHGEVALGAGPLGDLGQRRVDGLVDGVVDRRLRRRSGAPRGGTPPRRRGPPRAARRSTSSRP